MLKTKPCTTLRSITMVLFEVEKKCPDKKTSRHIIRCRDKIGSIRLNNDINGEIYLEYYEISSFKIPYVLL